MFQYQMWQRFEAWVSMLVCIWCTFVAYQREKAVLRKFYFCPVKTYIHANSPWTNIKLPAHITRHEFVFEAGFNRIAARNFSFIFPCFCLIKETNERYFLRFAQHKVSSNVNGKIFSDFIQKRKLFIWEVQYLVD